EFYGQRLLILSTFSTSLPRAARHNPLATAGAALVIVFIISAVFAPWIAPQDPAYIDLPARLSSPSSLHWCGTDELGRDIFSRLIYGSRISMLVVISGVAVFFAFGLLVGSIAAFEC